MIKNYILLGAGVGACVGFSGLGASVLTPGIGAGVM
jgi:hypothetical protein